MTSTIPAVRTSKPSCPNKGIHTQLTEEEQRHVAQGLSEEELAIFDILTKPEPTLTKREEAEVKKVAKTLLQTLKWEKLVLDWRLKQQACAEVQETIAEVFDTLPEVYSKELFDAKRELAYRHIYAAYAGAGESIYEQCRIKILG